jgi:hypothetical protein
MNRLVVAFHAICALLGASAFAGCSKQATEPDAALAAEPFFIRGPIARAGDAWGYLVKGEPGTDYRVDQAYFTVGTDTELRHRDGSSASAADLAAGRVISLWITGPIMESYPVQVRAERIVID